MEVLTEAQQRQRDCSTAARELKLQAGCEWGSGGRWGHRALLVLAEAGTAARDVTAQCGAGLLAVGQQHPREQRAPDLEVEVTPRP